jgi:CheY-like chemotaxis protein
MVRNILIVDDDQIWLRVLEKKLEKYRKDFEVVLAGDGEQAMEVLQSKSISLVVTDMQMPNMDGLTLLAHMSESYPDIPVMVVTAYSTPKLKRAVLERGGAGYIEKPFVVEDLARKIIGMLKKQSEGGILQTIPLEMFIQLIEMEQKTCTIRVFNKSTAQQGVLFFREGDLMDARLAGRKGLPAAYAIFSWLEVALTIQDTCPVEKKRIDKDLQAILMDAMRIRDEGEQPELATETDEAEQPVSDAPAPTVGGVEGTGASRKDRPNDADANGWKTLEERMRTEKGFIAMGRDESWNPVLQAAASLSRALDAGLLQAVYASKAEAEDWILVPGISTTVVVRVEPSCARDRLFSVLSGRRA